MNDAIGRGGVFFSRILQAHVKVAILTELFITAVNDLGATLRYIPVLVVSKLVLGFVYIRAKAKISFDLCRSQSLLNVNSINEPLRLY